MLHFLPAGRELIEPMELGEAFCRAIYKRPSADAQVYQDADGETLITLPWASEEEARDRFAQYVHASLVLHRLLEEAQLTTYALNPATGGFMRVPSLYWLQHPLGEPYTLREVESATGWDAAMVGQPIVIPVTDLERWSMAADAALERLQGRQSPQSKRSHPSSLEADDAPLIEEMRALVGGGQASGPYAAALLVVDRAVGGGTMESKVRRLERRYISIHGEK